MSIGILSLIGLLVILIAGLGVYYFKIIMSPQKLKEIEKVINTKQYPQAIKSLQAIIKSNNFDYDAHRLLGKCYMLSGNPKMAIMELRQAEKDIENRPISYETEIRENLASLYEAAGDKKEALQEYILLLKSDSKNGGLFFRVGKIFSELGSDDKALQYLRMAAKLEPGNSEFCFVLGKTLYLSGQNIDAITELTNAVRIDSRNFQACYFLGMALKEQQEFGKAIELFESAERERDLTTKAILAKAICYTQVGNYVKVISEITRGLRLSSKSDPDTMLSLRYFLANAYEIQREIGSAIEQWEAIHKENPKYKEVPAKLEQYKAIRQSDSLKDYMCESVADFSQRCHKIVEKMDLAIHEEKVINKETIDILAREQTKMMSKPILRLFRFTRISDPVPLDFLREALEFMKNHNAQMCIYASAAGFSSTAKNFANTRPFQLVEADLLNHWLMMAEKDQMIPLTSEHNE